MPVMGPQSLRTSSSAVFSAAALRVSMARYFTAEPDFSRAAMVARIVRLANTCEALAATAAGSNFTPLPCASVKNARRSSV